MSTVPTIETGFVDVKGGRLYYEVAGVGHPLVLIHAGVADCRMWDEQFAAFAQRYRVIRYDARGFGKTTSANVAFSNRQDLIDLLIHLGVTQTYILGLSRGGSITIDFTLEHPEMVAALIVVAGGISGYEPPVSAAEAPIFAEYQRLAGAKDFATLADFETHVWGDGPTQPMGRMAADARALLHEMIADNYRLHQEELEPHPLTPPAAGRLDEIHAPTLVISGDLDFPETNASMEYLTAHVAGAQKVVIPGVAHMVNMEQPERFDTVVLDFLARL